MIEELKKKNYIYIIKFTNIDILSVNIIERV